MVLPEFLQEEKEEVILQRMLARIPEEIDKSEGSFIYDALAPAAAEMVQMKIEMGEFLKQAFASTAFGEYLELRAEEQGVCRKKAVKAQGTEAKGNPLLITGIPGTVIPQGTIVSTAADEATNTQAVEFVTLQEKIIPAEGTVQIDIAAVEPGIQGNVPARAINLLAVPLAGVTAVTNEKALTGGLEEETDESLLQRYYEKVRKPITSGNKWQFISWAKEVSGVGGARVFPVSNSLTVRIVIVDNEMLPANDKLVEDVQQYLDPQGEGLGLGVAPLGARVIVEPAKELPITIGFETLDIDIDKYTQEQVLENIAQVVKEYFQREISFKANEQGQQVNISIAKLGSEIFKAEGLLDYTGFTISGGSANLPVAEDEVPIVERVTVL